MLWVLWAYVSLDGKGTGRITSFSDGGHSFLAPSLFAEGK